MRLTMLILLAMFTSSAALGAQSADRCRTCWILANHTKNIIDCGLYCITNFDTHRNKIPCSIVRFIYKHHVTRCYAKQVRYCLKEVALNRNDLPDEFIEYPGAHPHLELVTYQKNHPAKQKNLLTLIPTKQEACVIQ